MKHEIIELHDVQIIGMAKKIAFNEAKEECPKFWGEYVDLWCLRNKHLIHSNRWHLLMALVSLDSALATYPTTIALSVQK